MTLELWQCVMATPGRTVAAFLQVAPDGRLLLSLSDTDALELGLELGTGDALALREALGRALD